MSKRAERRHHRCRIINKFKSIMHHWYYYGTDEEKELWIKYMASRGSIGCGCSMCANPRRKHSIENGQITRKEIMNKYYYENWENEH